ncbi:MAG: outer membrane protein OmpA-like peptidoglycan-associated protein [Saprospiraceae bacterium]|jgi:outer membrane protein OmpA-like peptidoglycan-associated protein
MVVSYTYGQLDQLPANPDAGKCYVSCVTPEEYATEEKRVLVKPAYKTLSVSPAEYRTEEEQIMIKPASKRFVYVPATFTTSQQTMQVEDPYNEIRTTPASFAGASERILVQPKAVRWEYQNNTTNCQSPTGDCIVACAVEYPEEYRNVPTQVVDRAAGFTKTQKGGRSITVDIQEIGTPARVDEIEVPAEYTTITKRILVKDEAVIENAVPAEYAVETMQIMSSKGGVKKWEEVDCELLDRNVLPILYNLGSAALTSEARSIIDLKLLNLMKEKPLITVEISSHTDSRGSSTSNQSLSQRRAESVVNYLVNRGIKRARLVASGYGETQLKNGCSDGNDCTEAQHQVNRRTEFRILN